MPDPTRHTIRYGQQEIVLHWPGPHAATTVGRRVLPESNPDEQLQNALRHPLHAPSLKDFLQGCQTPLVVVNDATRSTPTARVLEVLLPDLAPCPDWRVIVATGLHRPPTDGELAHIFGGLLPGIRDRILIHDGRDDRILTTAESPAGSVFVNSALLNADRVLLINSVEPHFFAGYTGGCKSIIPGLAGYATVQRSHAGALSPSARPLEIKSNPVREYIDRAAQVVPADRVWSVQVVLDGADRVARAAAGNVDACFVQACRWAQEFYAVDVDALFDIVIAAVHPPLDLNLYQMQKGWELSIAAVRPGGALIITSACTEGTGSPFYQRLSEEFPNQDDWLALADRPYTMGLHKLVRIARAKTHCRLMAVTQMDNHDVERFGYESYDNVNDAIAEACAHTDAPVRALIVNDAALTTVRVRR